jgi:hypothetical protein
VSIVTALVIADRHRIRAKARPKYDVEGQIGVPRPPEPFVPRTARSLEHRPLGPGEAVRGETWRLAERPEQAAIHAVHGAAAHRRAPLDPLAQEGEVVALRIAIEGERRLDRGETDLAQVLEPVAPVLVDSRHKHSHRHEQDAQEHGQGDTPAETATEHTDPRHCLRRVARGA